MRRFILGLDEGTTNLRSVLYNVDKKNIVDMESKNFKQYYPRSGWVEQDADEIYKKILSTSKDVLSRNGVKKEELLAIGITNQRETVVAWDRETGEPVYKAIVWQCRRTSDMIAALPEETKKLIKEKTIEQWNSTGLDTCKLVAEKIKKNYKTKLTISDTTLYSYTCNSKRELWGKAFGYGEIGYCVYELCKEVNNECIPFTTEEIKIKNDLLKKYFGSADEKIVFVKNMLENEEITEEESWQTLNEMMNIDKNYMEFKSELELKIGYPVVRATRVFTSAF